LFFTVAFSVAQAQKPMSDREKAILGTIRFDQNLNQQIPLDLEFVDETGQTVQLKEFFGEKPVILVMAYYECSMLCTLVLNGLLNSLKEVDFDVGNQFNVVTVSIDPDETPEMATEKKESYLTFYGRPGAEHGWHFLTGEEETIRSLTDEIGFHYVYDDRIDEYAHPSGIIIATPEGRISRYFYGIEYPPNDVRLGLIEASAGKIGSTIDQILLMCYHYDPDTGRYNLVIRNVMKIAGTLTFFCVAIPIIVLLIRERRSKKMENSNNPILRI
jgi:protein SCO1/2